MQDKGSSGRKLMALGLSIEAGCLLLGLPSTPLSWRIGVQGILFLAYVAAVKEAGPRPLEGSAWRTVFGLALLFRLTLLMHPPFYSDDLYRYLWDGHVQVAGHLNPYRFAPADPALAPLNNAIRSRVNHPEIPTLYPPMSQIFFALVALAGGSMLTLKGFLVAFDLAQVFLLRSLLSRFGLSSGRIVIYAWSPLVIAEVAGNGHLDAMAVFWLVLGIHLIIVARPGLSTASLGMAAASKLLPILTFPVLARRIPKRFWPLPFLLMGLLCLPYLSAGGAMLAGLREYAERWQHNDSLFRIFLAGLEAMNPTPWLKVGIAWLQEKCGDPFWIATLYHYAYPVYLARMGVALALVGATLVLALKGVEPVRGIYLLFAFSLLISPTVHPWYLLWLIPFLPFFPSRAWLLLTGLIPLSYLDSAPVGQGGQSLEWVRWAEYLPFYSLLILERFLVRRKGSPFLGIAPYQEPSSPGS